MGYAQHQILLSTEEYLQMERNAPFKSEYFNGQVYAMSGASIAHNDIVTNLIYLIRSHLKGKSCKVYPSDVRVKTPAWPSYFYPDVSIICGKPEIVEYDNVLNPSVIIEVGSRSTEEKDRVIKFGVYREIATMKEYILVSSLRMEVTRFYKVGPLASDWFESVYKLETEQLRIDTIGLDLPLSEIYDDVTLGNSISMF